MSSGIQLCEQRRWTLTRFRSTFLQATSVAFGHLFVFLDAIYALFTKTTLPGFPPTIQAMVGVLRREFVAVRTEAFRLQLITLSRMYHSPSFNYVSDLMTSANAHERIQRQHPSDGTTSTKSSRVHRFQLMASLVKFFARRWGRSSKQCCRALDNVQVGHIQGNGWGVATSPPCLEASFSFQQSGQPSNRLQVYHYASCATLMLLMAVCSDAATLTVCNANCNYTRAQLSNALAAALPGDTILLEQNYTFVGDFVLPNQRTCVADNITCMITVKTGVTSTGVAVPGSDFPAANRRIDPSYSSKLAKIQPSSNNAPAIRTNYPAQLNAGCASPVAAGFVFASPNCVSKWWTFSQLEFLPNAYGGFTLLYIGSNDTAGGMPSNEAQNLKARVPDHFTFDQLYVHGNAVTGQHRGWYLNANHVEIKNSYCADMKLAGEGGAQDSQCISYLNGAGDLTITNNYLSAASEDFMAGGDDIRLARSITVASGASSTGATLSADMPDAIVGDPITCTVGGTTPAFKQQAAIATFNHSTFAVTWTPAFTGAPSDGIGGLGTCWWNVVPKTMSFTKNFVTKDTTWANPVLATVQNVTTSVVDTGGTFAAGTYTYRVTAKRAVAYNNLVHSTPSAEISATVSTGTTNSVTITWTPVTNATYYHVYGRSAGGQNFRLYLAAASCSTTCSVTDTNAAPGSCSAETTNNCTAMVPGYGTLWLVKNLFELKNWDTATVEGNILENIWVAAQGGYAFMLSPANQSGGGPGNTVANITMRNNLIRHASAGADMVGADASSTFTQIGNHFTLTNNLWVDSGDWGVGSPGRWILFTGGKYPLRKGPDDVTITHNTVIWNGGPHTFVGLDYNAAVVQMNRLIVRDNMFPRLWNGCFVAGSLAEGTPSWNWEVAPTGSAWTKNVCAGATCSLYPDSANNYCPTETNWHAEFVNYAGGDYHLKSTSLYHNVASDGADLGANIDTITPFTNIAQSGDNTGGAPPPSQPAITSGIPPDGITGQAYSFTATAASGTAPYTWTVSSGAVPTGLTLATSGLLSGTPSASGSFDFALRVTDSASQSDTHNYTVTVTTLTPPPANFTEVRPSVINWQEAILFRRDTAPTADDQVKVGDIWYDLSTNVARVAVDTTPPAIVWMPIAMSAYSSDAVCDAAHAGAMRYVAGGAGVKDTVSVCARDTTPDGWAWRPIY